MSSTTSNNVKGIIATELKGHKKTDRLITQPKGSLRNTSIDITLKAGTVNDTRACTARVYNEHARHVYMMRACL